MAEANPSTSNMSSYDQITPCDPCSLRDAKNQAGTYCQDCSEYLCQSCEDIHRSSKDSQNHSLQTLKGPRMMSSKQRAHTSSVMKCEVHRNEVVTLFCASHKTAICNVCKSVNHKQCDTKSLRRVAKEPTSQQTVSRCTEQIKGLLKDFKEIKNSRDKNKTLINNCSNDCLEQVAKVKQQIIAWAETLSKDMTNKIKKSKDDILTDLEKDTNTLTQLNKQSQEITNTFETLGQEAAFVLMMKEEEHIKDITKLKNDMLKQPKPVALEFYQSKTLKTLMFEITSMGKLEYQKEQMHKPESRQSYEQIEHQFCFQDITSACNKKAIDAGATWVSGCAFMPNGELVICDRINKSVKVFTQDFKLRNEMEFRRNVWGVAALSKNEVIVTQTQSKFLQILKISRNIEKGKSIRVTEGNLDYWGIDYKNDRLYISGHKDDGGVLVTVLTLHGVVVNTFNISHAFPYYLAVNSSGNRILVSGGNNSVLCFDNSGNPLYTYTDRQFDWNAGLLFDSKDNFLVCGGRSHNIYLVKGDDSKHTIPLTSTDGLHSPYCLAYRPADKTLVVGQNGVGEGQNGNHSLLAFTMNSGNSISKIKLEI